MAKAVSGSPYTQQDISLSVLVPMYNESAMVQPLFERLLPVLKGLQERCEIVVVDDGSKDKTWGELQTVPESQVELQCVRLSRNFGKEAAMSAGLKYCRGLAVIILDADLQDPPELIPDMLDAWRQGFDVVNMRRSKRLGETWFKRFSAHCFYRVINWMSDAEIPENVGDFRLLSRQVVDSINRLPERNRFMKGLFSWPGFKQTCIEFEREPRHQGDTKWPYGKLFGLAMDGITSFSFKPLRFATWSGLITALAAFGYGIWVVLKTLVMGDAVAGYPSLMVVQLALAGIQLLSLGLIGEYLGRVFIEVKQRPLYLIDEVSHSGAQQTLRLNEARTVAFNQHQMSLEPLAAEHETARASLDTARAKLEVVK